MAISVSLLLGFAIFSLSWNVLFDSADLQNYFKENSYFFFARSISLIFPYSYVTPVRKIKYLHLAHVQYSKAWTM